MALFRKQPTCPYCGEGYKSLHNNMGKHFVGDTFRCWDISGHDKICKHHPLNKSKTMTININKIKADVLNFLNRLEHKLPEELISAAEWAENNFIAPSEKLLSSGDAVEFTKLVPEAEPFRVEILAILGELETAFKAVSGAYQKGTLLTAQAQLTALKVPGLPNNHYSIAAQEVYSKKMAA